MSDRKTLRCECGWQVVGTEDEIVPAVIEHGLKLHNMRATREDVLARLERAGEQADEARD
jgi:predicted small metal-binding protein